MIGGAEWEKLFPLLVAWLFSSRKARRRAVLGHFRFIQAPISRSSLGEANVEGYREMAKTVEKAIASGLAAKAETAERAEAAAKRVAKIERGGEHQADLPRPSSADRSEAASTSRR